MEEFKGSSRMRPINGKALPIIADEAVEKDFGTGILKITPAHDKLDFEIAQRHDLPMVEILNPDGTLNDLAGSYYKGLERFSARKKIAKRLEDDGLLVERRNTKIMWGFPSGQTYPLSLVYPNNGS